MSDRGRFLVLTVCRWSRSRAVKSYARARALWWQFLGLYGLGWDAVKLEDFGSFLGWLRTGDTPAVASIEPRPAHPAFQWRLEHPYHREVDLGQLPEPMRRELCFAFWRIIEQGLRISDQYSGMARSLELILIDRAAAGRPQPVSLMALSLREWEREWRLARARLGKVVARVDGRATRTRRSGKLALRWDRSSRTPACWQL